MKCGPRAGRVAYPALFVTPFYVGHEGDVIGELIDREQPDVILHFVAERFLATYPHTVAINRALG